MDQFGDEEYDINNNDTCSITLNREQSQYSVIEWIGRLVRSFWVVQNLWSSCSISAPCLATLVGHGGVNVLRVESVVVREAICCIANIKNKTKMNKHYFKQWTKCCNLNGWE